LRLERAHERGDAIARGAEGCAIDRGRQHVRVDRSRRDASAERLDRRLDVDEDLVRVELVGYALDEPRERVRILLAYPAAVGVSEQWPGRGREPSVGEARGRVGGLCERARPRGEDWIDAIAGEQRDRGGSRERTRRDELAINAAAHEEAFPYRASRARVA